MCYRDLPISTRERITDYYEHKYAQKRLFDEHEILSEISPPLRNVSQITSLFGILNSFYSVKFVKNIDDEKKVNRSKAPCGLLKLGKGTVSSPKPKRLSIAE